MKAVIKYCLIPFCLYFISAMLYFTKYIHEHHEGGEQWSELRTDEKVCLIILVVLMFYFGIFELLQLFSKGWRYFIDFWNLFDMASIILNTLLIMNHLSYLDVFQEEEMIVGSFFAMLIMYVKAFAWLRLFDATSFYIRLVVETIKGIKFFIIIYIFF